MFALAVALAACPPANFSTQANFDLDAYVAKPWFIQQQMETNYLPPSHNLCVEASYSKTKSFWGYDIAVHNLAYSVAPPHAKHDSDVDSKSGLCAKIVDAENGKLKVAPCFLPTFLAGEYWVLHFDDAAGVSIVSGGAPTHESNGACATGTGTNGAGFWIFTRQQGRDEALVQKARSIAQAKGFDLSVLNDVDQSHCPPDAPTADSEDSEATAEPCCVGACAAGLEKVYSVAAGLFPPYTPHCGEACMDPKKYGLFHLFEKNLTKAGTASPCEALGYTAYDSTTTHGFGPVSITLDLYDAPKTLQV